MSARFPGGISPDDIRGARLSLDQADHMVENVVATYALPYTVVPDFVINTRALAVPMVTDDPEVISDCIRGAVSARAGGGFTASSTMPVMIGQIQVLDVPDFGVAVRRVHEAASDIIDWLNTRNPSTVSRHSKAVGLEVRIVASDYAAGEVDDVRTATLMSNSALLVSSATNAMPEIKMLVVHIHYDCANAMGANLINTACEAMAPRIELLTGGRINLCILSNLSDRRRARAMCVVPGRGIAGSARQIVDAARVAEFDAEWAIVHNKRVMDAIEAVVMATANDWRAIEAGAHA
jgi:hydroxymethylglutaryl-CoA reductase